MSLARMAIRPLVCDVHAIRFNHQHGTADWLSLRPSIDSTTTSAALHSAAERMTIDHQPVVVPTETVYGLAAPVTDALAVSRIFKIKGRPADNPLIAHISSLDMLSSLVPESFTMPVSYTPLVQTFWPGPLTLLFPVDKEKVVREVTAGHNTIAVRMPSHPIARALIALAGIPLAAPSANTSGKPSPTRASHVAADLAGKDILILDGGPCDVGMESTVIDGLQPDGIVRVLRPGGVTVEALRAALPPTTRLFIHGRDFADTKLESAPTTPGMKYRHYSPRIPLILLVNSAKGEAFEDVVSRLLHSYPSPRPLRIGLLLPEDSSLLRGSSAAASEVEWRRFALGAVSDPQVTAQRLFDGMLTLEEQDVSFILAQAIEETHEGLAVMNRLRKAASEVLQVKF